MVRVRSLLPSLHPPPRSLPDGTETRDMAISAEWTRKTKSWHVNGSMDCVGGNIRLVQCHIPNFQVPIPVELPRWISFFFDTFFSPPYREGVLLRVGEAAIPLPLVPSLTIS